MADNSSPATGAAIAAAPPAPAVVDEVPAGVWEEMQKGFRDSGMVSIERGNPEAITNQPEGEEAEPEAQPAETAEPAAPEATEPPAAEEPAAPAETPDQLTKAAVEAATKDFQVRLTAAEAKATEATAKAEALGKQLEAGRPIPVADGVPLVRTEAELDAWVAKRNEIIAWCNAHRDGVTADKEGDASCSPEEVQGLRDRVDMELRTALPKAQKLVAAAAYWDGEAQKIFPTQFTAGSPEAAAFAQVTQQVPGLLKFPHARIIVGQTILGQKLLGLFPGKSEAEILSAVAAVAKATGAPKPAAPAAPAKKSLPPIKSSPGKPVTATRTGGPRTISTDELIRGGTSAEALLATINGTRH